MGNQTPGGERRRLRFVATAAVAGVALTLVSLGGCVDGSSSDGSAPATNPTLSGPASEPGVPTETVGEPPGSQPPATSEPSESEPPTASAPSTGRPPVVPPSSRPTAPSSSRPPSSREQYEEVAQRELEQGLVAYNPPSQARVQEDFELTVRVQRGTATVTPSLTALPGTPPVVIEQLPVGTYMRAQLRGAGFDVQPLSDDLQLITGVTEWAWRVTPQADGLKTLRLTLVVVLEEVPLSNRTFDRSINVDVKKQPPWYHRARGLLDMSGVITALVIAAILGSAKLGRTRWLRRKAAAEAAEQGGAGAPPSPVTPTPTSTGAARQQPKPPPEESTAPPAADGNKPAN